MIPPKRADWLDQAILDAKPDKAPNADFDAWRSAHAGSIRVLKQRGARLPRHTSPLACFIASGVRAMRNPIAWPAIAAALIVGVFLLAILHPDREPAPTTPAITASDQTARSGPAEIDNADKGIDLAHELFIRGDVGGLIALLDTGQPRTIVIVAAYLAQIGDLSTVSALQASAAKWQGLPGENPFARAVDQIRRRYEQNDTKPPDAQQIYMVAGPSTSPNENQVQTCRGVVLNRAGEPVNGASVWVQSCTKDLKMTDVAAPIRTDQKGRFSLAVPAGNDVGTSMYLLGRHPQYALGWIRLPADRTTTDLDDGKMILYEPTVVAGTVMDTQGRPVRGALVEARVVPAHNPMSVQEYPYVTGNGRAVKTDAAGQFVLDHVPEGAVLSLSVSCRGYASYDSREGRGRWLGLTLLVDPELHTVRAGRQDVLVELMSARGRISGRIVNEDGSPYDKEVTLRCQDGNRPIGGPLCRYAAGRCTLMESPQRGTHSRGNGGRFRIDDLLEGRYWVAAADPVSGDPVTRPMSVVISESRPQVEMTLQVCRTAKVTVRLTEKKRTGKPVADTLVVAEYGFMVMHRYTDPNGQCVFHLVPGDYAITTHGWLCDPRETRTHVTSDVNDLRIDVPVYAWPQIRGRLVDESGAPVRGLVSLFLGHRASTDADGRFAIPQRPGDRIGQASDLEGTRGRVFSWTSLGRDAELEIRLEPVAVFSGRVLDSYGNPVNNASVVFQLATSEPNTVTYHHPEHLKCRLPLSDGRFRLEVPVGLPLTLVPVLLDGYMGWSKCIDPAPGQTYDLGDIILQPWPDPRP